MIFSANDEAAHDIANRRETRKFQADSRAHGLNLACRSFFDSHFPAGRDGCRQIAFPLAHL
jgi:hypothetical protein